MRFICDEMLAGFARWLRAAGHDAALGLPGQPDGELVRRAEAEDRVLLTKDRKMLERRTSARVLLLAGDDDVMAATLRTEFGLDWLAAPFTRCLVDNTALRPAPPERAVEAPSPGPVNLCPACGRLYWPGSHVRRMGERLAVWAGQGR